jgi:hypothetical protein
MKPLLVVLFEPAVQHVGVHVVLKASAAMETPGR